MLIPTLNRTPVDKIEKWLCTFCTFLRMQAYNSHITLCGDSECVGKI